MCGCNKGNSNMASNVPPLQQAPCHVQCAGLSGEQRQACMSQCTKRNY